MISNCSWIKKLSLFILLLLNNCVTRPDSDDSVQEVPIMEVKLQAVSNLKNNVEQENTVQETKSTSIK